MNKFILLILCTTFLILLIPIGLPVTGYHNWKSTHYMMQTRDFAENQNIPPHVYFDKTNGYTGIAADTLPVYQVITSSLFMVFGDSISLARLVDILFHIFSIIILFYLLFEITKNKNLSILSSAVYALFPISIYFSQNIMVLSTSMCFVLLGCYGYHRYRNTHEMIWLMVFPLSTIVGILSFYSFFIVPLVFIGPYLLRDLSKFETFISNIKEMICLLYSSAVSIIIGAGWLFHIDALPKTHEMVIDVSYLISPRFFGASSTYLMDNFSIFGLVFVLLGLFYIQKFYKKNKVFLIGGIIIICWIAVMSRKLSFHTYHWYPLVPFFAILCALGIAYLFNTHFLIHYKNALFVLLFVSFAIFYIPLFTTTFAGNDVAGEYIANHGGGNVFHSAYQSYSVMLYSNGNGVELPDNISEMEYLEDTYDFKWVYLYEWKFDGVNQSVLDHINESYTLVLDEPQYKLYELEVAKNE